MVRVLLSVAALGLVAATAAGPCDLKKLEKGWFDVKCDKLVEKPEKCVVCQELPRETMVCVKESGGKLDKARVLFKCEGCGKEGEKEGSCTKEACKDAGKKVVKTCSKSGKEPHATP